MAQRAEEGAWGVRGEGRGGGGGGGDLLTGAAPPLRAAQPPLSPSPPQGRRLHLFPLPSPSQYGGTALDDAKAKNRMKVIKLLENAPAIAAQVGRAAPHPATAPPPRLRRVRPCVEPHPWL